VRPDDATTFLIGIAARLAGMHPQTLRLYERRGLLTPRRDARNTRRYCQADVARLRRIQELSEAGLNLAGIERVLELEAESEALRARVRDLESRIAAEREEAASALAEARRAGRAEIVRVTHAQTALVRYAAPDD
jgi:MerR family transcriptional regulator/heat shock protein HspR